MIWWDYKPKCKDNKVKKITAMDRDIIVWRIMVIGDGKMTTRSREIGIFH